MTKPQEKRHIGKRHLELFTQNAEGLPVYTGGYHRFSGTAETWRRIRRILWSGAIAGLLCTLAAGFPPYSTDDASFRLYLPYGASVLVQLLLLWKIAVLANREGRLRSYRYRETMSYLGVILWTALALHAVQIVVIGIDRFRGVVQTADGTLVFLALCHLLCVLFVTFLLSARKALLFREEAREESEK